MSSSGVNLESYLIPLEEIKRATENFSQQRCIGGGGFGSVYKGQLSERWQNRTTAIKRLAQDSYQGEREFYNEVEMISRFQHENVISFIGYCDEANEMIIVFEYAINGSLDHHLQDPNRMRCITWTQRLMISLGAAKGLDYLHSGLGEHNRVIHRDVKSANILLDDNMVAKICDFGLSKVGSRNQPDTQIITKVAGTHFYLDPSYHESGILRKESDVYSFGVVLFEILSGMLVYHEMNIGDDGRQFLMNSVRRYNREELHKLIDPNIKDQIDSRSIDSFKEIAYECIGYNPMERPTMATVIKWIEKALAIQMSKSSATTPSECSIIESVLNKLNSGFSYEQRTAVSAISTLAEYNPNNRVAFAQAGAIPLLMHHLTALDSRIQENAASALFHLSTCDDNIGMIMSSGAVPGIVHVLREGSMEARENAASTLYRLSNVDENIVIIGYERAIPHLMVMLSEGTHRGKVSAALALYNLCRDHGNTVTMVRAGLVPMLMELLITEPSDLTNYALDLLYRISLHPEGRLAIGKGEVVPVLFELLGSGSQEIKANVTEFLLHLCSSGDQKSLLDALELGVMGKLIDLLDLGPERGKELDKVLRKMTTSLAVQQKLLAQGRLPPPNS